MTYEIFINNILETRGRFNCEGYKERHHIVPKCMGGINDKNNLIDLYPREHFVAHKLLAEENPKNAKLCYAYWRMCVTSKGDVYTSEEYDVARRMASIALSRLHKGKKWEDARKEELSKNRTGAKNPMYGRRLSKEHKEKLSASLKGRKLSKETRRKISERAKGRRHTKEAKQKMSLAKLGKPCPTNARLTNSKPVVALNKDTHEIVFVFNSMSDGARWCDVAVQSICACCKGQRKSAGGYIWKYVTKENAS